jgi:Tol biopolymer transport system component
MAQYGFRTALHGRPSAMSVLVLVGLLTGACTSPTSSASSSSPVTTATPSAATAYGATVDIDTGAISPLPTSFATSGVYYAVSPDHTKVAYSGCCSSPDPLSVANLDGTHIRRITPHGDAHAAQWSRDGSLLVYQQRNDSTEQLGNLFVLDMRTGKRAQVTNFDQTLNWGLWSTFPSFAADGRSILFQLPRGDPNNPRFDLWSVPVAGGGQQTLVRRNAGWGGYSPDGQWLAYLSPVSGKDFAGGGLWIARVHRGTARALVRDGRFRWLRWSPDGTRIAYSDTGSRIYVVDAATGSTRKVADGGNPEWFDNHTLILGNPEP